MSYLLSSKGRQQQQPSKKTIFSTQQPSQKEGSLAADVSSNQVASLPPNVNGRRRGTLELQLGSVCWKGTKSYPAVELRLLWWGQRQQERGSFGSHCQEQILRWEQGKPAGGAADRVAYRVLTSDDLFRKYLRAAEPIQIHLLSSRTQTLIGTAQIPVPGKIINFKSGPQQPLLEASGRGEIFSSSRFNLGELQLQFRLAFDPVEVRQKPLNDKENLSINPRNKPEMVQTLVKSSLPVVMPADVHDGKPLSVEGVPVPLHQGRPKSVKTFRSLDNGSRNTILNYLSGKRLSGSEDEEALSEICSVSPAESMLEALAKYDSAPKARKDDYLRAVDSVRMAVECLRFTKAGLKEIVHRSKAGGFQLGEVGVMIKVRISPGSVCSSKIRFGPVPIGEAGEIAIDGKANAKIVLPKNYRTMQFEFMVYLSMAPAFHRRATVGKQIFVGSSIVKMEELIEHRLACYKKCPVNLSSDDILLGSLTVRLELGARNIHFGPELIDAFMLDKENVTISSSSSSSSESDLPETVCWEFKSVEPKCSRVIHECRSHHCHRPLVCSQGDQSPSGSVPNKQNSTQETQSNQGTSGSQANADLDQNPSKDKGPKAMDTTENSSDQNKPLLYGMLHLGHLKEAPALEDGGYFLVAHGFWSDSENPALTTEMGKNGESFNYLLTFPVFPNNRFLERTRNQHMLVELWQKSPGAAEKLIGVTRLPLHQFYIAFRDAQLADHLSRAKLPVISIDGWSGIGSPLAGDSCGQLQAVLAIGTENQIEYFKLSRNLTHTSGDAPVPFNRPNVPRPPTSDSPPNQTLITPSTAISLQRAFEDYRPINTTNSNNNPSGKQQSEVANMLSAFIENLAQRLPISSERSTAPCLDKNSADPLIQILSSSPHSQANYPQLRKTSDLLENLQKALLQQPNAQLSNLLSTEPQPQSQNQAPSQKEATPSANDESILQTKPTSSSVAEEKLFSVSIEIEQAVNLPKLKVSKKFNKRNKNRNSPQQQQANRQEVEPSAYVTFEGFNLQPGTPSTVKSHEGIVYTTPVIEVSSNPRWEKKFDVKLPVELMTNDEKLFILKVWRKPVNNGADVASNKSRQQPAPMEDAVIGFTSIDLSVFLNGLPNIMGWYNIMDFSGRCNGQVMVKIQPKEDVTVYKQHLDETSNFQIPLSIDVDCVGLDAGNTSLSRALKRKFTELEQISQRLKARLFDVTGDENIDPDDEFEKDLNTEADEGDDDDWVDPLEDTSNQKRNSQYPNGALTLTTNTSSYSMSCDRPAAGDRSLTGCSDRSTAAPLSEESNTIAEVQQQLENLLKTHDLDTLINPNILRSLINPAVLSTSESTPMSNPYANLPESESSGGTSVDAEMSEDSQACASAASDKVKLISSALQRATISDEAGEKSNSDNNKLDEAAAREPKQREAPEGEPMKDTNK
ncbi:uncharacterized protein LOC129747388 [Uranotaenia lowii]|uniref:uncharacterized protein LOC129747388 n=1 Tax=Uranotaenia lowii TaxID=190385 RepID=UPI00247942CE|nr:uncharacterized protein LOC129747388 [Uranotaenia lowii]